MVIFRARPKVSNVTFFNNKPASSVITVVLVKIAISCKIDFLNVPKAGALTAVTLIV